VLGREGGEEVKGQEVEEKQAERGTRTALHLGLVPWLLALGLLLVLRKASRVPGGGKGVGMRWIMRGAGG
jgi:hypothetical protein